MLMAVEYLGETTVTVKATVIETSGEAVVRHDVGQVVVGQSFDVTDAIARFAPKFLCAMVTVL